MKFPSKAVIFFSFVLVLSIHVGNGQDYNDDCNSGVCSVTFEQGADLKFNKDFGRVEIVNDDENKDYRMTLILGAMTCNPSKNGTLIIKGDNMEHQWCTLTDYSDSDFSGTKFIAESTKGFTIEQAGDWDSDSEYNAYITVTVFKHVKECADGEFFCGRVRNTDVKRCISEKYYHDNRPNCGGFTTNEDEKCRSYSYYDSNCNTWYEWAYVWTALFGMLIVVIVPTIVLFMICCFRSKRRRQNLHRRPHLQSVPVRNLANDHPPTYSDLQNGDIPPPCFCSTVKSAQGFNGSEQDARCVCVKTAV